MIKVEIVKEVEVIKQVTVDGHADYAEHGSDIVCAGVFCCHIRFNKCSR